MKEIKVAVEYETHYETDDGKIFKNYDSAIRYEEIKANETEFWSAYKFFDSNGNSIDIFTEDTIPDFCYLLLTEKRPKLSTETAMAIVPWKRHKSDFIGLPNEKGLYYNDWSNAYNGAWGHNGWIKQSTHDALLSKIEFLQKKIKIYEKMGW